MGTCLFADDIVLIVRSNRKLQEMLDTVANFAEAWKIKINAKKCGVLVVGEKLQKTRLWKLGKEKIGEGVQISGGMDQQTGKCLKPRAAPDREGGLAVRADEGSERKT